MQKSVACRTAGVFRVRSIHRQLRTAAVFFAAATLLAFTCCTKKSVAQESSVDLRLDVKTPFQFVAYGDTRFHDPADLEPANPAVRVALPGCAGGAAGGAGLAGLATQSAPEFPLWQ